MQHADGDFEIDRSARFQSKVLRYNKMLAEIDVVSESLQTRGITWAKCRDYLDVLSETVRQEKTKAGSALYGCKLGTHYISPTSEIVPNLLFESGLVKIQKGLVDQLTAGERNAVHSLRYEQQLLSDNTTMSTPVLIAERLAQQLRKEAHSPLTNS